MTTPATPRSLAPATASSIMRSRHTLYGTEDRVILDLGSRIWKIGFSGEASPRACLSVLSMLGRESQGKSDECSIWDLEKSEIGQEEWIIMEERVKIGLRMAWFDHLMSDPKSRKVIVIESPFLPIRIKEMIARILFSNLQVPSVRFASSHLLALLAVGSVSGLVVDCGNLETTVLPIYCSRPIFSHVLTTPKAGARVTSRLRSLLLRFGSYVSPPSSLSSTTVHAARRIPIDLLSEEVVEEIKTRLCFVGERVDGSREAVQLTATRTVQDVLYVGDVYNEAKDVGLLESIEQQYSSLTSVAAISFPVPSLSSPTPKSGVGRGWIHVPGWIRERAAEVLFDENDGIDEPSVTQVILESLQKLPIDLRQPLASSILIIGGTPMLPGFLPRLRAELLHQLSSSVPKLSDNGSGQAILTSSTNQPTKSKDSLETKRLVRRLHDLRAAPRFSSLISLTSHICFVNSTGASSASASSSSGSRTSTSFAPCLLSWIGGSLAGAMKIGGEEMPRERWQELLSSSGDRITVMADWSERGS